MTALLEYSLTVTHSINGTGLYNICNTLNNVRPRTSCETIILSPNKDIEHKNNKMFFLTDFSISTCCGLCMSHLIESNVEFGLKTQFL